VSAKGKLGTIIVLVFFSLIWFSSIQHRDLFQPDEGRYAEIPREMVATGDWLTPRLDGFKYFEKPPLQYWATATAYSAFGQHNWTARLWSYLTGAGTILLVWLAGDRLFGRRAGQYAALALASSLLFGVLGRVLTLDTGLTFFMTASLAGFLLAQQKALRGRSGRSWMLFAWVAMALAVLSKGLIGIVLPAGAVLLYTLLARDWRIWRRLNLVSGLALFLLLAAPWFVLVSLKNPDFFQFFFIHEHFQRFLTKVHHRYEPWWFFLPILAAGSLPWLSQMLAVTTGGWRRSEPPGRFDACRFLWSWAFVILVFFSLSDSKLPPYIEPMFPALALLVGRRLAGESRPGLGWDALASGLLGGGGLLFLLFFGIERFGRPHVPAELYAALAPWLAAGLALMLAGALAAWIWLRRGESGRVFGTLALSWFLALHLWVMGGQALAPSYSAHDLARKVAPCNAADLPFYSVWDYDQTLPFYLNRTLTVVRDKGELEFGIGREPQKWIPDIDSFLARWQDDPAALAVIPAKHIRDLKERGMEMEEIARDPRRVVVKKP